MTQVSLSAFPSITNLKLHNISVTPRLVVKVITNLDLSKASAPNCIPVVVLKSYDHELPHILVQLFNMCLKESCFPDCLERLTSGPCIYRIGESWGKFYN